FIGGNVAYLPAGASEAAGGYRTVDISNLDNLHLIEGVDAIAIAGGAMALNGSGLAVGVQTLQQGPPTPGLFNDLDVINVTDPSKTGVFITRYTLPGV